MKFLYQCDKCKKLFTDSSDACKCEESHTTWDMGFDWDDSEEFKENVVKAHVKYDEENSDPSQIAVILKREYYDENESKWVKERSIGVYKLKSVLPLGTKNI